MNAKAKTIRAAALGLVGAALAASQGCASLIGTAIEPTPYVGVQADAAILKESVKSPMPLVTVLALADMGASTALDTAFLPITIPCALSGQDHGLLK